jgi:uncharacterized protein
MATSTKQFAVVTGASSGIGYELAKQFAQNGFDLLVASEGDGINTAAREFEALGANVQVAQVDLASHDGVHKLEEAIQSSGRRVDAIAINAGVGVSGRFLETDLAEEINMVELNVVSTLHLAKLRAAAASCLRLQSPAQCRLRTRLCTVQPKPSSAPFRKVCARN